MYGYYLNYKDLLLQLGVLYLYNVTNPESELHLQFGALVPLVSSAISYKVDNTLFLSLGMDLTWGLVNPESSWMYIAFTVGLDVLEIPGNT